MSDKLYSIHIPRKPDFAQLLSLYVEPGGEPLCTECRFHGEFPMDLLLEWEEGSEVIPDFIAAGARIVARRSILEELSASFNGIVIRKIEFHDHPALYKPQRITKRTKPCVWLPYGGPPLAEMTSNLRIPILLERSTVTIQRQCNACRRTVFKRFNGIEKKNSRRHTPREEGKGLFFDREQVGDTDLFVAAGTGLTVCSARLAKHLRSQNYTSPELLEIGDLV